MSSTDNTIKKICVLLMNVLFLSIFMLGAFHIDVKAQTFSAPTVTFSDNFSTDKWITEPFTFSISGSDLDCQTEYANNTRVRYWYNQELDPAQGINAFAKNNGLKGEIFTCSGYQGKQGIITLYTQVYCAAHHDDYSEICKVTFKYDDWAPTVKGSLINGVITIQATDNASGVQYYGISKSKEVYPTEWSTDNKFTPSEYGSYYLFAKDEAGNIGVSNATVNSVTPIDNYPIKINATYSYTGQPIKPNITVVDINNPSNSLIENKDYTVSLSNNVNAGTATATITGIGNYTGTITKTFVIDKAEQELVDNIINIQTQVRMPDSNIKLNNKYKLKTGNGTISYKSSNEKVFKIKNGEFIHKGAGVAYLTIIASETDNYKETQWKCKIEVRPMDIGYIKVISSKSKLINIKWEPYRNNSNISGYQIQVSMNKNFTKSTTKTYTVKGNKSSFSKTIKGLKKGKKYYVRIRSYYTTNSEGTLYGDYSTKKSVKVKK